MKAIFQNGIPEKYYDFGKGLCVYMLGKFYIRFKKLSGKNGLENHIQDRLKIVFDVIKNKSENEFLSGAIRKTIWSFFSYH